jgi:hypothetical protein
MNTNTIRINEIEATMIGYTVDDNRNEAMLFGYNLTKTSPRQKKGPWGIRKNSMQFLDRTLLT